MELGYAIKYDIHIRRSANMGFIVKIGCGEFVSRDVTDLKYQLGKYLDNPEKYEKEYTEKCGGGETPEVSHPDRPETRSEPQAIAPEEDQASSG